MAASMWLRYCTRCVMPETRPDLSIDEQGICDACRSADLKNKIDWEARKKELAEVLERYRSKDGTNYDCIVPSSGGKDSTYQVYVMKHVYGLNPLVVTWHPCNQSDLGRKNILNLQRMGVDHIEFTGNPNVYKKLIRIGLEIVGDCCWPEHVGIFTVPVQVAVAYRVPLIVWGENSQLEYGGPATDRRRSVLDRRWMEEYGGLRGLRVEDLIGVQGLTRRDLLPYIYPSDQDLARVGVTGIFLGYFHKWDARTQLEVIKKYGFSVNEQGPQEGTYTNYENLDCKYVGIHDYFMYLKYGFGRATAHACIDIRNGRLTREKALELVKQHEGMVPRRYLKEFLEDLDMTEEQFFRICDSFTNKAIFKKDPMGNLLRDQSANLIKINHDNVDVSSVSAGDESTSIEVGTAASKAAGVVPDVAIVDYEMGNVRSVAKAFELLGCRVAVTNDRTSFEKAKCIVLPGVGAFADGMHNLRRVGVIDVLRQEVLQGGKPFLGICLGMQLLAALSEESGKVQGLHWVPSDVRRLRPSDPALKVPHIGWESVRVMKKSVLFEGLGASPCFYFVHGYHFVPQDNTIVTATCDYGGAFVAAIEYKNIFATQFHPEKSQRPGLGLIRNFLDHVFQTEGSPSKFASSPASS